MNHTANQVKDIRMAKFFNALLYREYIYNSKAENCPRSKILANIGILNKSKDKGDELRWMGVVPVNAGLNNKNNPAHNAVVIKDMAKQLIKGNINLFIFPEGALAALTVLPMKFKFQPGVSAIIKMVLDTIEKIKVVPLGFAHNNRESAIHIGNTILFSKKDSNYYAGKGNCNSKFFDKNLSKLWKNKDEILLTQNGVPVKNKDIIPYISGILMKNMECCSKEAKLDLKKANKEIFKL